jgi:hypothetical protein
MHYILAVNEVEKKNKLKFPIKFREDKIPNLMQQSSGLRG